jgi:hypothetical protein
MGINTFLHTNNGKVLLSIILGIGLSTLFRKVCKDRSCIVFKAPNIDEIKDKIFEFNNKCFKFEGSIAKCETNKKIIDFA